MNGASATSQPKDGGTAADASKAAADAHGADADACDFCRVAGAAFVCDDAPRDCDAWKRIRFDAKNLKYCATVKDPKSGKSLVIQTTVKRLGGCRATAGRVARRCYHLWQQQGAGRGEILALREELYKRHDEKCNFGGKCAKGRLAARKAALTQVPVTPPAMHLLTSPTAETAAAHMSMEISEVGNERDALVDARQEEDLDLVLSLPPSPRDDDGLDALLDMRKGEGGVPPATPPRVDPPQEALLPGVAATMPEGLREALCTLRDKGGLETGICILGRSTTKTNAALNGVYATAAVPQTTHGGAPIYQKLNDPVSRYLYFSTLKSRWKINDKVDDKQPGFAYTPVVKGGDPKASLLEPQWRVFDGTVEGYNKDPEIKCYTAKALFAAAEQQQQLLQQQPRQSSPPAAAQPVAVLATARTRAAGASLSADSAAGPKAISSAGVAAGADAPKSRGKRSLSLGTSVEPHAKAACKDDDSKLEKKKQHPQRQHRPKPIQRSELLASRVLDGAVEQAFAEERLLKALLVEGRDASMSNASINGIYALRSTEYHGAPSYEKLGGGDARVLFYSATKGIWKISDNMNDSKIGFAYIPVKDFGKHPPSQARSKWRVFNGGRLGWQRDSQVSCVDLAPVLLLSLPNDPASRVLRSWGVEAPAAPQPGQLRAHDGPSSSSDLDSDVDDTCDKTRGAMLEQQPSHSKAGRPGLGKKSAKKDKPSSRGKNYDKTRLRQEVALLKAQRKQELLQQQEQQQLQQQQQKSIRMTVTALADPFVSKGAAVAEKTALIETSLDQRGFAPTVETGAAVREL